MIQFAAQKAHRASAIPRSLRRLLPQNHACAYTALNSSKGIECTRTTGMLGQSNPFVPLLGRMRHDTKPPVPADQRLCFCPLGQKRTLHKPRVMSALPPKADIDRACWDVRFVPKADIRHGRLEHPKFFLVVLDDNAARAVPGQSHRIVHCGAKNSRSGNWNSCAAGKS